MFGGRCQFRASAHGVRGVSVSGNQLVEVGSYADPSDYQQHRRDYEKPSGELLLPHACVHQHDYGVDENDDGQIVRYLRVVRLYLHAEGQCEQHRSEEGRRQPRFPCPVFMLFECAPVGEDQCGKYPGHKGDSLHLRIVPDLDDLQVIGAECDGNGTSDRQQPVHAHRQHEQESAHEGDEQEVRRSGPGHQDFIDRFGPVSLEVIVHGDIGHASEHGIGPIGRVIGMLRIVLHGFLCHASPSGEVRLVYDLSAKDFRHEAVCEDQKKDRRSDEDQYPVCKFPVHLSFLFIDEGIHQGGHSGSQCPA